MAKKKYYMVHECEIRNYEERHDYYLYKYEANAMKKLKDMRDQDHMPVVDEENYEIRHNTPTHFEAGFNWVITHAEVCALRWFHACDG